VGKFPAHNVWSTERYGVLFYQIGKKANLA